MSISINWLAVIASTILSMGLGWLWYGPLFGKQLGRLKGKKEMACPPGSAMCRPMMIGTAACFMTTWVFAWALEVWRVSGEAITRYPVSIRCAIMIAVFAWIGFSVPYQMHHVAWEGQSWKKSAINAGHDLVYFLMIGIILWTWH